MSSGEIRSVEEDAHWIDMDSGVDHIAIYATLLVSVNM